MGPMKIRDILRDMPFSMYNYLKIHKFGNVCDKTGEAQNRIHFIKQVPYPLHYGGF